MVKFRKMLVENKGFTLIELLVVIAVLGILAAIAIPRLQGVTDKARVTQAQTALSSLQNGMEMHKTEYNYYPDTYDGSNGTGSAPSGYDDTDGLAEYLDNADLASFEPDGWTLAISAGTNQQTYTITATPDDTSLDTLYVDQNSNGVVTSN